MSTPTRDQIDDARSAMLSYGRWLSKDKKAAEKRGLSRPAMRIAIDEFRAAPESGAEPPVPTPPPEPTPAPMLASGVFPPDRGLALPRTAGDRLTDPDTGLTIECIDDRAGARHPYPVMSPENSDGTMMSLHDSGYQRYEDFNGHPIVRSTAGGDWRPVMSINTELWFWSETDPDVMFALVKPPGDTGQPINRLVRVNVAEDTSETLIDFAALGCQGHASLGNSANDADRNDRYLAVQIAPDRSLTTRPSAILVVDMQERRVSGQRTPRSGSQRVTSRMSASGRWLQVDDASGHRYLHAILADGSLGDERQITALGADGRRRHFPASHSAMLVDAAGDDVIACDWGGAQSFMVRCRDLQIGFLPATGWGHIGRAAADGWCADYSYGRGGTLGVGTIELVPLKWGEGEPVAQSLDTGAPVMIVPAAGRDGVRHVAWHGSGTAYSAQPQASQGASGRVYWTSAQGGVVRELCAYFE